MKYLGYALIAAFIMLSTLPSWGMYKDSHEIRFPNPLEIADALNHDNNFFNEQNIFFNIEAASNDYFSNVKNVEIISPPFWRKPSQKSYVSPESIFSNNLVFSYLEHFAIKVAVKITFSSNMEHVYDTLTINLFLPDIEGFPSKRMILGNEWSSENFAVVTPARKAFYVRQKDRATFLCPTRLARNELLTKLQIYFSSSHPKVTGFDFGGTSWFIYEDTRRTLIDWGRKYTILAIDGFGGPQFTYESDVVKAQCRYRMVLAAGSQLHSFEFSLSTILDR